MTAATTTRVHRVSHCSASSSAVRGAAIGSCGILLGFAGLQVALAAGAPLGEHVWGGTQEPALPSGMRLVAAGAAVVLTGAATVVARRAGLVGSPAPWLSPATWGIAGYLALNTVGNLASTSAVERYGFGSATAAASMLTAFVAVRMRGRRASGPREPRT